LIFQSPLLGFGQRSYRRIGFGGTTVPLRDCRCHIERFTGSLKKNSSKTAVSSADDIAIMTKAFDLLLAECKLTDRTDPVVTMVAKLVIELVRNGERDPEKIRQKIIGRVKSL
jgi:hypothetical protein